MPEGNTGVDGNFVYLAEAGEDVELAVEVTSEGQSGGGQLPSIGAQPGHPGRITQDDQTRLVWEWTSGRAYSVDGDRIRWRAGTDGSLAEVRVRYAARSGVTTSSATEVLDSELAEASQGFGELKILPGLSFDRNGDGVIESTVIGIYPNEYDEQAPSVVQRNSMLYHPPDTFYRLDQATRGLQLSAHATLGTLNPPVFDDEKVRFVALDPNLVVLWEELRNQVEEAGKSATGLRILRGFISPHERQRLERMGVKLADFTRYQYGDAFAIIYDLNNDFRMDDLNKDGEITIEDSEVLGDWVEAAMKAMDHKGGIGTSASFEGPNHIGTPYVHADLRGWRERWQER
ncbi:hypothetical protein KQI84_06195 [bacterium]|nr:hypothetical protein [bacterium]